jgi:hypothetical protein
MIDDQTVRAADLSPRRLSRSRRIAHRMLLVLYELLLLFGRLVVSGQNDAERRAFVGLGLNFHRCV